MMIFVVVMLFLTTNVYGLKKECMCPCECKPDGVKLKNLINCFATWSEIAATDGNSYLEGCKETDVIYCRTTNDQDMFCKFDGTNYLETIKEKPTCWFSCGMRSCDAFLVAHSLHEGKCISDLYVN